MRTPFFTRTSHLLLVGTVLKLVPSFKDAQILQPCFTTRSRVTLTQGNSRRQRFPHHHHQTLHKRALVAAKAPQCTFHQSFTTVRVPHAAFPESLGLFTPTLLRSIVTLSGNTKWVKRDQTPIPKDPFSWKKVESRARWANLGGKAPAKADAGTHRTLCYSAKNASKGTARPPGRQGAQVGSAPSGPLGPPRRRGWVPGTRGALPSPPPPGVGLLRCLSDGQRSESGSGPPGVPACRSPLHGQEPASRCRSEFSGSLRRRRSSRGRGVNAPPSAFQPARLGALRSFPPGGRGVESPSGRREPVRPRDNSGRARSRAAQAGPRSGGRRGSPGSP